MSVISLEERRAMFLKLADEEQFTDLREGRNAALTEGLRALLYARRYALRGEDVTEIMNFNQVMKEFSERDFSLLKVSRSPIGTTGASRIEVSIFVEERWLSASYICFKAF